MRGRLAQGVSGFLTRGRYGQPGHATALSPSSESGQTHIRVPASRAFRDERREPEGRPDTTSPRPLHDTLLHQEIRRGDTSNGGANYPRCRRAPSFLLPRAIRALFASASGHSSAEPPKGGGVADGAGAELASFRDDRCAWRPLSHIFRTPARTGGGPASSGSEFGGGERLRLGSVKQTARNTWVHGFRCAMRQDLQGGTGSDPALKSDGRWNRQGRPGAPLGNSDPDTAAACASARLARARIFQSARGRSISSGQSSRWYSQYTQARPASSPFWGSGQQCHQHAQPGQHRETDQGRVVVASRVPQHARQ